MLHTLKKHFQKPFRTLNTVQISRESVLANLDLYQSLCLNRSVFPVLKSNAYGHGIREVASILSARKLDYIVVDSYYEALEVHQVNKTRILLMGYTLPENFSSMDFSFITPVVYDADTLRSLGETGRKMKIHLKIDTGMHRQGIYPEDVPGFLSVLRQYRNLELEGVCTHLADADSPDDIYTLGQVQKFRQAIDTIWSE